MKYRTKKKEYKNGYAQKIQYWASLLDNPTLDRNYILDKITYFTNREMERVSKKPSVCQN